MTQKANKIWIVTREHNDYNQHGEYFVCAFAKKPTLEQIAPIISKEIGLPADMGEAIAECKRHLDGGGRKGTEDVWLNLNQENLK